MSVVIVVNHTGDMAQCPIVWFNFKQLKLVHNLLWHKAINVSLVHDDKLSSFINPFHTAVTAHFIRSDVTSAIKHIKPRHVPLYTVLPSGECNGINRVIPTATATTHLFLKFHYYSSCNSLPMMLHVYKQS